MRRSFLAALAAVAALSASASALAQTTINGLTANTTPASTDSYPCMPTGATVGGTKRCTAAQVVSSGIGSLSAGAIPNTAVAGLAASATTDTTNAANISSGTLPAARLPALTGDVTTTAGSAATSLATVNSTPGTCQVGTVNAKGLTTACSALTAAQVNTAAGGTVAVW